jgi:hypothetical protein
MSSRGLWESPSTGTIYRVGRPGEHWEAVGLSFGGPLSSLLAYAAALLVIIAGLSAWLVALGVLVAGTLLMYLPAVLPLTVPLALAAFLATVVRVLAGRRRASTLVPVTILLLVFLGTVVLNAAFWYSGRGPGYIAAASFPTMCALSCGLAVVVLARRKLRLGLALLLQALVFALPYLGQIGSSTPFGTSALRYDNLLTLSTWLLVAFIAACWVMPARLPVTDVPSS